jgi:hypothetical protein
VAHAALSTRIDTASALATTADTHANTASAAATSADAHAAAASAAATSVDARVNTVSNAVSVVSTAASNALSVANAASNAASVVSQALSVANATLSNLVSAHNVLSNRVSANSGTGGAASVTSNELSAAQAALQLSITALSNQISNLISAGGGGVSVTSNELSIVSAQAASALSDAMSAGSVTAQNLSLRDNSIMSVVSAHIARTQEMVRGGTVSVVSAATLTDIASLVMSFEASTMYQIRGVVMFENATSGGFGFGISLPALAAAGSYVEMWAANTMQQAGAVGAVATQAQGRATFSAIAAGNTTIVSVSATTVNLLKYMNFDGIICTSAAGTGRIMARTSVAGASMSVRAGYIRAYKLGAL